MHGKEFGGHWQSVELWRGRNSCGLISPNKLKWKRSPTQIWDGKMGWVKKSQNFWFGRFDWKSWEYNFKIRLWKNKKNVNAAPGPIWEIIFSVLFQPVSRNSISKRLWQIQLKLYFKLVLHSMNTLRLLRYL